MNLRPSSAHIWINCVGWHKFRQEMPPLPNDNTAADEGTYAHELAAKLLLGEPLPDNLSEEMADGITLYADDILSSPEEIHIEESVEFSGVAGTPDAWVLSPGKLTVWDFKYGRGLVEVKENPQLILYACGIAAEHEVPPDAVIEFRIVQPRGFHKDGPIRSWEITRDKLADLMRDMIIAITAAQNGGSLTPGGHCRHCEVRHECPALQKAVAAAVEFSEQPDVNLSSPASIGVELQILKIFQGLIKDRITGLEAQAMALIKEGKFIPGFRLEYGVGNKAWKIPVDQVVAMGDLLGIALAKPGVITPTQALKLKMDETLVDSISHRPSTGLKLVSDDGNHGKEMFENDSTK